MFTKTVFLWTGLDLVYSPLLMVIYHLLIAAMLAEQYSYSWITWSNLNLLWNGGKWPLVWNFTFIFIFIKLLSIGCRFQWINLTNHLVFFFNGCHLCSLHVNHLLQYQNCKMIGTCSPLGMPILHKTIFVGWFWPAKNRCYCKIGLDLHGSPLLVDYNCTTSWLRRSYS